MSWHLVCTCISLVPADACNIISQSILLAYLYSLHATVFTGEDGEDLRRFDGVLQRYRQDIKLHRFYGAAVMTPAGCKTVLAPSRSIRGHRSRLCPPLDAFFSLTLWYYCCNQSKRILQFERKVLVCWNMALRGSFESLFAIVVHFHKQAKWFVKRMYTHLYTVASAYGPVCAQVCDVLSGVTLRRLPLWQSGMLQRLGSECL